VSVQLGVGEQREFHRFCGHNKNPIVETSDDYSAISILERFSVDVNPVALFNKAVEATEGGTPSKT
jgi:hypothetical protein